jgi:glycerol-3-phosphate dehydrogenase
MQGMPTPIGLNPDQRAHDLERMKSESFDVVVIGAGVTGAGTALDAATRGLSVALVEQRDYASGTSSRSSKLFHGGLRYLEQFNFKLVMEALHERNLMLNLLCPHLATPITFMYPIQHPIWERAYVGAGVLIYDVLAALGDNPLPHHRHLSRRKALRMAPALRRETLVGAIVYSDALVDDARHTMMISRTASKYGAALAPSVRAIGFEREGDRVVGVLARDLEAGDEFVIRSRQVVNSTGVWTDEVQEKAGRGRIHVRASKGIHLVVPRDRIHSDTGMIMRTDMSVLFVIPWGRHWIVGTTDTEWNLDLAHPAASRADIDYLLEHVNTVLKDPLRHDDIEGVFAGLRPLLEGESDATSRLSREHAVSQAVPGLISVAGGKYTTYRVMAVDAIDMVAANLDEKVPPAVTASTPLVGADGYRALWNQREELAARSGLHIARVEHLLGRYGSLIGEILELIRQRPELGRPLDGADDYLAAEISYAASHEGALHLDDALTRRTRISIETWDRGVAAAEPTARLMGEVLGWTEETVAREIDHYLARVAAERESQEQRDDQTADAARLGAPDVRTGRSD